METGAQKDRVLPGAVADRCTGQERTVVYGARGGNFNPNNKTPEAPRLPLAARRTQQAPLHITTAKDSARGLSRRDKPLPALLAVSPRQDCSPRSGAVDGPCTKGPLPALKTPTLSLPPTGEKMGTATSGRRYPPKGKNPAVGRDEKGPSFPHVSAPLPIPGETFSSSEPAQHRTDRATTRSSLEAWVNSSGSATPGLLVVELEGGLAWRALAHGASKRAPEEGWEVSRANEAKVQYPWRLTSRDKCEVARGERR